MKIVVCKENDFKQVDYLYEALRLDLHRKQIVSFVGAGGKTSLLFELANELGRDGTRKVVVVTTTHMFIPEGDCVILSEDYEEILSKVSDFPFVVVGRQDSRMKMTCVNDDLFGKIEVLADVLLIEADGSKGLPLKVPADFEPVIPMSSTMVVGVAGLDSVYKPLEEVCHRACIGAGVLGVPLDHVVEARDVSRLLASDEGQRKNVGFHREFRMVLNKADSIVDLDLAKQIVGFMDVSLRRDVVITSRVRW